MAIVPEGSVVLPEPRAGGTARIAAVAKWLMLLFPFVAYGLLSGGTPRGRIGVWICPGCVRSLF